MKTPQEIQARIIKIEKELALPEVVADENYSTAISLESERDALIWILGGKII